MGENRVITRRTLSVRLKYAFGADELVYTISDRSGEVEVPLRYEAINVAEPFTLKLRDVVPQLIVLMAAFALLACAAVARHGNVATALGVAAIAVLLTAIGGGSLGLFTTRYTMFNIRPGPAGGAGRNLRVMAGRRHDEIILELKTRWRDQLRRLYLAVDRKADPAREAAKFAWLEQHGVISAAEHAAAVRALAEDGPAKAMAPTLN